MVVRLGRRAKSSCVTKNGVQESRSVEGFTGSAPTGGHDDERRGRKGAGYGVNRATVCAVCLELSLISSERCTKTDDNSALRDSSSLSSLAMRSLLTFLCFEVCWAGMYLYPGYIAAWRSFSFKARSIHGFCCSFFMPLQILPAIRDRFRWSLST
jgi:hypothetical protein